MGKQTRAFIFICFQSGGDNVENKVELSFIINTLNPLISRLP